MLIKKTIISFVSVIVVLVGSFYAFQNQITRYEVPSDVPSKTVFKQPNTTRCQAECPVNNAASNYKSYLTPVLSKAFRSMVPPSSFISGARPLLLAVATAFFAVYALRWAQRLRLLQCVWRI